MKVKIGENIFSVKIADNNYSRAQGMMKRTFTDEFNGMLFLMNEHTNCFWMKDCVIPLDIIFIDKQTISKIHHDCLPCDVEEACEEFTGFGDRVLELQGGTCQRLNIKEGDIIRTTLY